MIYVEYVQWQAGGGSAEHVWKADRKIINKCDDRGAYSLNDLTVRLAGDV